MNPTLISQLATNAEKVQAQAGSLAIYVVEHSYLSESGLAQELAAVDAGRQALSAIATLILNEASRTDGVSIAYSQLLAETLTRIQKSIAEDVEFINDCLN